jgi:hypothetical protein
MVKVRNEKLIIEIFLRINLKNLKKKIICTPKVDKKTRFLKRENYKKRAFTFS